jgi:hypothetical protein
MRRCPHTHLLQGFPQGAGVVVEQHEQLAIFWRRFVVELLVTLLEVVPAAQDEKDDVRQPWEIQATRFSASLAAKHRSKGQAKGRFPFLHGGRSHTLFAAPRRDLHPAVDDTVIAHLNQNAWLRRAVRRNTPPRTGDKAGAACRVPRLVRVHFHELVQLVRSPPILDCIQGLLGIGALVEPTKSVAAVNDAPLREVLRAWGVASHLVLDSPAKRPHEDAPNRREHTPSGMWSMGHTIRSLFVRMVPLGKT